MILSVIISVILAILVVMFFHLRMPKNENVSKKDYIFALIGLFIVFFIVFFIFAVFLINVIISAAPNTGATCTGVTYNLQPVRETDAGDYYVIYDKKNNIYYYKTDNTKELQTAEYSFVDIVSKDIYMQISSDRTNATFHESAPYIIVQDYKRSNIMEILLWGCDKPVTIYELHVPDSAIMEATTKQ